MAQTLVLRPDRPRARRIGKLDFTRISAEAGAIAINAVALLLLLAPMNMHVPQMAARDPDVILLPVLPKTPPPRVGPEKVEIEKPRVVPTTSTSVQQKKVEIEPLPIVDPQPGDTAVDPLQVAKVEPIGNGITPPLAGAHLEYEVAPPPPYPIQAIREGLTGTVMLRVLVDVDGKPIDVQIERSSGHRALDAAARKQVLAKWRFKPALENGRAVQAIGLIPIDFNL